MEGGEIMTIEEIIEYVLHTPYNTNRAILTEMLKQLIISNGGTTDPDAPSSDIIYDGGVEVSKVNGN
jgi:hypothetical protein